MNEMQLLQLRLASQQLTVQKFKDATALVSYMGAMQAQDFAMSKWAIGIRSNTTEEGVINEINKGNILRTHVLRPTWHYVSANDIYPLLHLCAAAVRAIMRTNNKKLQLNENVFKKTNKIIEQTLNKNDDLNRDEIAEHLKQKKIILSENRLSHILMEAELSGIVCSGKIINNRHTYSLLEKRVKKKEFVQDEAAAKLAATYFESHGPATTDDFKWWAGLSGTKAKEAVKSLDKNFITEKINNSTYYFKDNVQVGKRTSVFMLPSYDEMVISYKDRGLMLTDEVHKKVISSNGIFWPVIIINGKAAGKWSRKTDKEAVYITIELFNRQSAAINKKIITGVKQYGLFIQKKTVML